MNKREVLKKTERYVKNKLLGEGTGHDWWHIVRVKNFAVSIGKEEKADLFIVEVAALLHDIADHKFHGGDSSVGPRLAREWLEKCSVDEKTIEHIENIISNMSFHKSFDKNLFSSLEMKVVQDADRIDSLGAIGIARAFAYGGKKDREIYNPTIKPRVFKKSEDYKKSQSHTINHFYEKILKLKDMMNTKAAKNLAAKRHKFMEEYLIQFFAEWEGKR